MECIASVQSSRSGRAKQLFLMLVVVAPLLASLMPGPANASSQDVVVTATVFLNPLEVQASAPSRVRVGDVFEVEATIWNHGELGIEKATAAIHLPKNVESVRSKVEVKLGNIPAHKAASATWRVTSLKQGGYVILVCASGTYDGAAVTNEDTVLVHVSR